MNLIRTLLTGGATPSLEGILSEGLGFVQGSNSLEVSPLRNRCCVALLPLEDGVLDDYSVSLA